MGCSQSTLDAGAIEQAKAKEGGAKAQQTTEKQAAKNENKEYQAKMQFLSQVPLMKRLPKDQHPLVASVCQVQNFEKSQVVIQQGDSGNEFFVIRSGEASVHVKEEGSSTSKKIATLKAGDYFGENALLRDEPRSATIIAEASLSAFRITRADFQSLDLNSKLQFAKRRAVGGQGQGKAMSKEPTQKSEREVKLITEALKRNENLATMTTLDDVRCKSFVDRMWREEVEAGEEIIKEGDLNADFFYVVQEGSFEIFVSDSGDDEMVPTSAEQALDGGETKIVSTVTKGGSFGELALLYFVPRAATVKAKEHSVVWVIDRSNFKEILMKVSDNKIKEYIKYLDNVEILSSLLTDEKKVLAKALVEMHFQQGELIIQQGEPGNTDRKSVV